MPLTWLNSGCPSVLRRARTQSSEVAKRGNGARTAVVLLYEPASGVTRLRFAPSIHAILTTSAAFVGCTTIVSPAVNTAAARALDAMTIQPEADDRLIDG